MKFSSENLLSINEVIADVLLEVDDEAQNKLTSGYYRAQVKYALDELAFDTFFVEITKDFEMPDDLLIEFPKGCFNLINIWAYTGAPDNVQYLQSIYWKRNFDTRGKEMGYGASVHEGNVTDPFIVAPSSYVSALFFNVRNGIIYLSDTCAAYDYIRIQFSGLASSELDIDKIKIVPPMVRKAVELWVTEKAAKALKSRDPKYRQIQIDAATQLDEYGLTGAWHEAKMRLKSLDKKMMQDYMEYNSKLLY
jgi:hypothetical protein